MYVSYIFTSIEVSRHVSVLRTSCRIGLVHLEALASCANAKPIIVSNPTVSKAEVSTMCTIDIYYELLSVVQLDTGYHEESYDMIRVLHKYATALRLLALDFDVS